MVAQSRGASFRCYDKSNRLVPVATYDDSLLSKALQDVADEFNTTQGRYLEQLDFYGKRILDRKPVNQLNLPKEKHSCVE